ncbi:MAG: type II toxin-antitoxin system RelE/ParE family toxin [Chloroflexi bacterium]|nr:type II toxin-antitoxin system RelE/ParE family toxin [Chloroflexota bacterium]
MIKSFADRDTERIFQGRKTGRLAVAIVRRAERKLLILHAAENVQQLRVPPGNRLEKLKGGRAGQHSIRINDQWRICFVWRSGHAHEVKITDSHS